MTVLEKLQERKNDLLLEQEKYNTKLLDSEIAILTNELDRKIGVRNSTLDIYKDYEKQIERIDQAVRAISELIEPEAEEPEAVESEAVEPEAEEDI